MKWERVSQYAGKSGAYTIGEFFLDGCSMWLVCFGNEKLKYCESKEEAKEVAETHSKEKR